MLSSPYLLIETVSQKFLYAPVSNLIFTLGSIYSTAVCDPDCVNGVCVGPQICSCEPGFHGYKCENGMLRIKDCRVGGLCCALILLSVVVCSKPLSFNNQQLMTEKSNCICIIHIAGQCDTLCIHGNCISRNNCTCHVGYSGPQCDQGLWDLMYWKCQGNYTGLMEWVQVI